ncbi:MAG: S53 family peptidase [Candidatus Doudnabacteria bacterium]|nr:S53 family peptidase [Candidatus Doudnabacteria bacterium]
MKTILFLLALTALIITPDIVQAAAIHNARVCSLAKKQGLASCNARVITDAKGKMVVNNSPIGFSPADLRHAYNLSGKADNHPVVAIVDAYDDPTIKSDLDVYSNQFGLAHLPNCKTDAAKSLVPCFQKISQRGTAALPSINKGWSMEIALDVEAVHAMCENCSILLVEATSPNMTNLMAAVDAAVKAGAVAVSNSYGGPEFAEEKQFDSHFNRAGIAFTVSSGDSGYGVQYPAASPYVTAVGGTSLYLGSGGKYKNEDAWSGAGSGCSQFEGKPAWQTDNKCQNRTVADVSAVADPDTGFAVYTTTSVKGQKGWFTAGGTSLSSPLIAAVYALAKNIPSGQKANSLPYNLGTKSNLHDVVGGSNGDCNPAYLCAGKTKYDGPTGLGSPNGIGAF